MYDNDHMNDSAVLRELRDTLSCAAMPARPPLDAITARGRARRRHHRSAVAGLSVAGAAAGTALAIGLAGAPGPATAHGMGAIRTAAFTIVRNANGTDTLTINSDVFFEPATLQNDLARFGIPAIVTRGAWCTSDPTPNGLAQVLTFPPIGSDGAQRHPKNGQTLTAPPTASDGNDNTADTMTINPAAMPPGTELSFGNFQLPPAGRQTVATLIDTNSHTCTSNPDNAPPGAGGVGAGEIPPPPSR
jgi:hypothetical protein